MAKSRERLLARELRRKGESFGEIAKKVGVAKSTASLWCRDIVLTEGQIEALFQRDVVGGILGRTRAWEWHRKEKRDRYRRFHKLGYHMFSSITEKELYLIGLALYWSEGSKRDGRVLLTNSDPTMILLYMMWLEDCLKVRHEDIVCRVTINELHQDRRIEIEQYWSNVTGIPLEQFTKTTFIHSKWKKVYENRNTYYGVLAVHVRKSTNLSYLVDGSIDRLREFKNLKIQYSVAG